MASKKILIQIQVGAKDANIAVANVEKAMQGLSEAQIKVNKNYKDSSASAGLHNAILMESGRLASDLNYGFTAIANNLGQLFSLFQASADSAGGLSAAFGKLLSVQALFLIGGQILIQNLDKITKFLREAVLGVEDLGKVFDKASSTVTDVNGKFELYIATLESSTKSEEEKAIAVKKLNEEYPDYIDSLKEADVSIDDVKNKTKEATEQNKLYRDSLIELAISRAAQNEIEKISAEILQEEINLKKIQEEQGIKSEEQLKQALIDKQAEIDAEQELINLQIKQRAQTKGRQTDLSIDRTRLEFLKDEKAALEGNLESYLGFGETANERIARLKEERDLYIEYVKLGSERNSIDEETKTYQESTIANTNKEISLLLKLRDIRNNYVQKKLDLEAKSAEQDLKSKEDMDVFAEAEVASIEKKRELALLELQDLEMSEGLKGQARADINAYYNALQIAQADERRRALDKINKLEEESKLEALDNIGKGLMAASNIAGKSTGVGKALAVAGTLVSTYSAGQKAYESQMTLTPDAPIRAQIARAAAILQGLANVRAIMSVKSPAMKETSAVTGGQGNVQVQAPDFNVVGQGGVNQLGQVIGSQFGQPIRAYVVSGDISSAQELDRSITAGATID